MWCLTQAFQREKLVGQVSQANTGNESVSWNPWSDCSTTTWLEAYQSTSHNRGPTSQTRQGLRCLRAPHKEKFVEQDRLLPAVLSTESVFWIRSDHSTTWVYFPIWGNHLTDHNKCKYKSARAPQKDTASYTCIKPLPPLVTQWTAKSFS